MDTGREAYEAYAKHTEWKSLATGQNLPQWDDLPNVIKTAWQVSASRVSVILNIQEYHRVRERDAYIAEQIEQENDGSLPPPNPDYILIYNRLCNLLTGLGFEKTVEALEKVWSHR